MLIKETFECDFFLAFSYVSPDFLPDKMHSHIGCICLAFLHCVFSASVINEVSMMTIPKWANPRFVQTVTNPFSAFLTNVMILINKQTLIITQKTVTVRRWEKIEFLTLKENI